MEPHALPEIGESLHELVLSESTTAEQHDASVRVLENFNTCMAGLIRFSGESPWERHPEDELLVVMNGEVDITLQLEDGSTQTRSLRPLNMFVVPRGLWHRQRTTEKGVTLMFVSAQDGDDVTWDDPRAGD